jgi:hypothetical protein
LSNYYFSQLSPENDDYFHVTSFRGRPEQRVRAFILRADINLRMLLRKLGRQASLKTSTIIASSTTAKKSWLRRLAACPLRRAHRQPSDNTARTQEAHFFVGQALCAVAEEAPQLAYRLMLD